MNSLAQKSAVLCLDISNFINDWVAKNHGFKLRSFYGEPFALHLLKSENLLNKKIADHLIANYDLKDKKNSEFHWEFNNYAFLSYLQSFDDENCKQIKERIFPLRFKGTTCTNWTLLRVVSNLLVDKNSQTIFEAKDKIKRFQKKSGQILDDSGVTSFQYHCFSAAMIYEIYEITNDKYFLDSFELAVRFIRNFILPSGQSLYVGRGQEQSFGIGSLIYILSVSLKLNYEEELAAQIEKVIDYLNQFKRKDGSFPLVLSTSEPVEPADVDMLDSRFCGWYPYNNYFDYLPFMGFFIKKAHNILLTIDHQEKRISFIQRKYEDDQFLKIVKNDYVAIIAKPGGYWSNDISFPLIFNKDRLLTPLVGGEQFQDSLYTDEMLSFPVCINRKLRIRKRGLCFFRKSKFYWISPFGIVVRKFDFKDREIEISTNIYSLFSIKNLFYLNSEMKQVNNNEIQSDFLKIIFDREVKFYKKGYSASGVGQVFETSSNAVVKVTIL